MSALIKAGTGTPAASGLSGLSLLDIGRAADAYLTDARDRGEEIVAAAMEDANRKCAAIFDKARADGRAAGMSEGRKKGYETALAEAREKFANDQAALIRAMNDAVEQFVERRDRFFAQAQQDVILLGVSIARRLMNVAATAEDAAGEPATQAAREALECVRAATDVLIRTNPEDATALELFVESRAQSMRDGPHVRVTPDKRIERGGVLVETADSTVDASIRARIDQIAGELSPNWRIRSQELSLDA